MPQRGAQPRRGNAQPLCQCQGFVNARHAGPQDEVVGQFGHLRGADLGVDMDDFLTERPQDRLAPLEERRLAADEYRQVAGFGAALSFGDRRIQHADAARCRRGGDVPAGGGFHGAGDNYHAARSQTGQDAHGFQCDRLDLGVIGDHDEDGLAVRCDFPG